MATINEAGMFARDEYTKLQASSRAAADVVMPFVLEFTGAKSLIDIGCGVGTWLAAAAAQGITDYRGVDGDGAGSLLQIPRTHLQVADLREPFACERQFDLAMSIETAEHLPAGVAPRFVAQLTNLAPQVLFSAAITGQGGDHHINERWPSYWATLFA
jgi:cyclopropane fatty-acyl-phospholipid synthase-like methyltransferase